MLSVRGEPRGGGAMRSWLHGALLLGTVWAMAAPGAQSATISISCGAVGLELELCQEGAEAWAEASGNQVNVISTPNSATERLALYQQILAANSADIDVFQIDVIWPGILASHFIDLAEHIDQATIDQHFEAIVANNTVDGHLSRDALVHRCRAPLLPQGSAREVRQAAADHVAGADRDRPRDPGRRARRRQRQDAGASCFRRRPTRA